MRGPKQDRNANKFGKFEMKAPNLLKGAVIATVAVVVTVGSVAAAPITTPTGLLPGDQYRLAFVTSTTRDATSTVIGVYNTFVTGVANAVPELLALGTTWTAIGSTSAVDARDNTSTNPITSDPSVPIYLLNDTLLATGNADLWGGSIANPLKINEQGVAAPRVPRGPGPKMTALPLEYSLGTPGLVKIGFSDDTSF
ncbi:MAG: hypothetical protein O7D94_10580 [Planctomycetota bacterium]|nr:hypothetical protein [Planctomycetota bacterium]